MIETFADGDDADRWDARLRRHTREILRRHRERIGRVAAKTLARKTLSGDDIDNICAFDRPPHPDRFGFGLVL